VIVEDASIPLGTVVPVDTVVDVVAVAVAVVVPVDTVVPVDVVAVAVVVQVDIFVVAVVVNTAAVVVVDRTEGMDIVGMLLVVEVADFGAEGKVGCWAGDQVLADGPAIVHKDNIFVMIEFGITVVKSSSLKAFYLILEDKYWTLGFELWCVQPHQHLWWEVR
jgi:hypothetical protein